MNQEDKPANQSVGERSPFAGCAIFIVAGLMMIFLIGFTVVTLFRQFNEIAKFTSEEPVPLVAVSLEDREPALNRLAEKIEAFRQALADGGEVELELGVEEMNLAIAAYEPLKDLRNNMRVESISAEEIRLAISFELNGKPRFTEDKESGWITSDSRYLNGVLVTRPVLLKNEFMLRIDAIEVPDGMVVPDEFIGQMSPYRIAERYAGQEGIGEVMAALTGVEIAEGVLRFRKIDGELQDDSVSDEQVNAGSKRLFTVFAIAACVFLAFVAIIIFMGLRLKKKQENPVS